VPLIVGVGTVTPVVADDDGPGDLAPFQDVERWAAESRALDAVETRVRERWLRRQAEEEATFAGVLLAMAEREQPVVVTTTVAGRHVGPVEAVGADFVALRTPGGCTTVVTLESIVAVHGAGMARTGPRPSPAAGGRDGEGVAGGGHRPVMVTMAEVLAHGVGHRPRVQLQAGGAQLVGELRSVGADVVTLLADGDPPKLVYLRLPSLSGASFLDSG